MKNYIPLFAAFLTLTSCQSAATVDTSVQLSNEQRQIVEQSLSASLKDRFSPAQARLVAAKTATGDIAVCGTVNSRANGGHDLFLGVLKDSKFTIQTLSGDEDEKLSVFHGCQARGMTKWDVGLSRS
jgi:hypothetical protein